MTYTCRVCFESSDTRSDFIAPCACNGSQRFVHRHCLNTWLHTCNTEQCKTRCPSCHSNYTFTNQNFERSSYQLTWTTLSVVYIIAVLIVGWLLWSYNFSSWMCIIDFMVGCYMYQSWISNGHTIFDVLMCSIYIQYMWAPKQLKNLHWQFLVVSGCIFAVIYYYYWFLDRDATWLHTRLFLGESVNHIVDLH